MIKHNILTWSLFSFAAALIICLITCYNYLAIMSKMSQTEANQNGGYITYSIQHEDNPLDQDMALFKQLYHSLADSEDYEYYEFYGQYLEMPNQKGQFFEEGTGELSNQCNGIQCIQIDQELLNAFGIKITEGTAFQNDDFMYEGSEAIAVLMGQAYSSLYRVGDTFEAVYLFDEYTFRVIGFLSGDSGIHTSSINIDMDEYIVMPSFHISSEIPVTNGLRIHYANKTSGMVRLSDANSHLFRTSIRPLLENAKVGAYSWTASPVAVQYKDIFRISIQQTQAIIMIFTLMLIGGLLGLIYKTSKFILRMNRLLRVSNILLCLFLFLLTCFFYLAIQWALVTGLGVTLVRSYHFLSIGLLSLGSVFCSHMCALYKWKHITK